MEFGREAIRQLFRELAGGFNLNAKLLALLGGHPLDSRRQEEARAMSQELSRVFMASLIMLNPDDNRADEVKTASEMSTDGSVAQNNPTKDKLISVYSDVHYSRGQVPVTPLRKGREDKVITRTQITPSPYMDGYQWRKYGQKNIQNRNFARYYFKCMYSRDRRCMAKKQVQQQDGSRTDAPMYQVTYVNEHTCHEAVRNDGITATSVPTTAPASRYAPEVLDTTTGNGGGAFGLLHHRHIAGSVEENEAIVSCLATVINGPPPPSTSSPWALAAEASHSHDPWYGAPAWCSPSLDGSVAEMDFAHGAPLFYPAEAEAAELIGHRDADASSMDVARSEDTVWPQYT